MWYGRPCRIVYHLSSNVCCMSGTPTALRLNIWIADGGCIFLTVPLNVKYQSVTSQTMQYHISLKGICSRRCYRLRINGDSKQDILSQWFSEVCQSTSILKYIWQFSWWQKDLCAFPHGSQCLLEQDMFWINVEKKEMLYV